MYFAYTCNYHCCCMHTVDLFSVTKTINHSQKLEGGGMVKFSYTSCISNITLTLLWLLFGSLLLKERERGEFL